VLRYLNKVNVHINAWALGRYTTVYDSNGFIPHFW
jgi:hypothetical protein